MSSYHNPYFILQLNIKYMLVFNKFLLHVKSHLITLIALIEQLLCTRHSSWEIDGETVETVSIENISTKVSKDQLIILSQGHSPVFTAHTEFNPWLGN